MAYGKTAVTPLEFIICNIYQLSPNISVLSPNISVLINISLHRKYMFLSNTQNISIIDFITSSNKWSWSLLHHFDPIYLKALKWKDVGISL